MRIKHSDIYGGRRYMTGEWQVTSNILDGNTVYGIFRYRDSSGSMDNELLEAPYDIADEWCIQCIKAHLDREEEKQ
jgi:hypothetical protein